MSNGIDMVTSTNEAIMRLRNRPFNTRSCWDPHYTTVVVISGGWLVSRN